MDKNLFLNEFQQPHIEQLAQKYRVQCTHCGNAQIVEQGELFSWTDKPTSQNVGYVVNCPKCGSRISIQHFGTLINQSPAVRKNKSKNKRESKFSAKWGILGFVAVFVLVLAIAIPKWKSNSTVVPPSPEPSSISPTSSSASTAIAEESAPAPTPEIPSTVTLSSGAIQNKNINESLPVIPFETLEQLPSSISIGQWDTTRRAQGVEWNTDTMDTVYTCVAKYIIATDANGNYINHQVTEDGYFFSIEYYAGKLFTVWRYDDYSKFKLRIYDAKTLKLKHQTVLRPLNQMYTDDKTWYQNQTDSLCAAIDGITIAPAIGSDASSNNMKIYISYNCYKSVNDGLALNDVQTIVELDYQDALSEKGVNAERVWNLDLGPVKYGIQTLEFDRSTGNMWCAVRQGNSSHSLYLIDRYLDGNGDLKLVPNGSKTGWDCPEAGDGLCSLGNDIFYILIPTYYDKAISCELRKIPFSDLESVS